MRSLAIALLCLLALPAGLRAAPAGFEDSMAERTRACTACHGREGRAGPDGYYPRLAGKPAGYLYNQLLHFRDGRRHYGLMTRLLDPLSDVYLADIARHFASLNVPYPAPARVQLPQEQAARGQELALKGDAQAQLPACAQCHGKALMGVQPNFPALLGLPRDYLNAQLGAWRTGQRRAHAPDCMATIARRLSAEDLSAVTAWLAAQPVPAQSKPAPAPVPASASRKSRAGAAPAIACGSAAMPGEQVAADKAADKPRGKAAARSSVKAKR